MFGRRWLRLGLYVIVLAVVGLILLTHIQRPEYYQQVKEILTQLPETEYLVPVTHLYITDINVGWCPVWNSRSKTCGVWGGSDWYRVPKPLRRGWLGSDYFSYQQSNIADRVIVDIGVTPEDGWEEKGYGIWVKYGPPTEDAITSIDFLFGKDAVEPRPDWTMVKTTKMSGTHPIYLSYHRGSLDVHAYPHPSLKFNSDGKFKILQVADLHFLTGEGFCRDPVPPESASGCRADPRTLEFIDKVLEIEKPDLVVLTGDQIHGDTAFDSESALFKAYNPFIARKIPFAAILGNHDHKGLLSRTQVMELTLILPYSVSEVGPGDISGAGNYVLTVASSNAESLAATFYFIDTHEYSKNPKFARTYDWIHEDQLSFFDSHQKKLPLAMAFIHIPLPEYRNVGQGIIGQNPEGVTAPHHNSGARDKFAQWGVQVATCGHDHANDYCLKDSNSDTGDVWLCYGGGAGEGGYGGYNGYVRRLRLYELDETKGSIRTWKRREDSPDAVFDDQTLVGTT